jgi:23S rRNA (uracil1939-C5)-methyltransferase
MSRQSEDPRTFEITIEKLISGGSGFARHKGKVIFVPFSAPGDHLTVRPFEEKKSFIRAEIVRILKPGKGRVAPVCAHFKKCGGCHWQHLDYRLQLEAKQRILEEAFHHRFPQTREMPIPIRDCPQPFAYRSRARIQLRGAGAGASVGFFRPGSHTVEDVESCPLFRKSLNEALSSVRQFKLKVDTDSKPQEMDIACSEEEDSWATARCGESSADEGVTTLLGTRRRGDVLLRKKVGGFTYSVTASVFFQANDFMVSELVALVQNLAKPTHSGPALDLFAGVGLFSLPLAHRFTQVVAVENSLPASRLCLQNANAAGLGNVQAACADVATWLEVQGRSAAGSFDLVLLDPPRTGAGSKVMKHISELAPKRILYISCDPQTLIRDLAAISPRDYTIRLVEGLDMFPQTYHFETVVQLDRN